MPKIKLLVFLSAVILTEVSLCLADTDGTDNGSSEMCTINLEQTSFSLTEGEDADIILCVQTSSCSLLMLDQVAVLNYENSSDLTVSEIFTNDSNNYCWSRTVTAVDDDVFEDTEMFTLTLRLVDASVPASVFLGDNSTAIVTITDNDEVVLEWTQTSYTLHETDPLETVMVCVSHQEPAGGIDQAESINLQFSVNTANIRFPATLEDFIDSDLPSTMPLNAMESVCVTLTVINDMIAEQDESFKVQVDVVNDYEGRVSFNGDSHVTITIIDNDVLPAPTNLKGKGNSIRSVSLQWVAPESEVTLAGYNITVLEGGEHIQTVNTTEKTYTIVSLEPYRLYTFSVNAYFVDGRISESVSFNATPSLPAPSQLTEVSSTPTTLTLSWTLPPEVPDGVITGYTVYVDYLNESTNVRNTTQNLTFTLTHLMPYQNVSIEISANGSVVEGLRSESKVFTTAEAKSGPVNELTLTKTDDTVTVNWNESTTSNGVIQYYIVSIGVEGNSSVKEYNTTSSAVTITINDLAPYTPYNVSVTPVNGAGRGETVSTIEFTVEGVPISHPRDIEIQRISDTIVQLSWTPLTRSEARGFITNYTVVYWIADSSDSKRSTVSVEGNSANITGLDPGSAYLFTISASTVHGASNESAIMRIPATMAAELPLAIIAGAGGGAVVVLLLLVIIVLCIVCKIKSKHRYKPKQQNYVLPLKPPRNLDFTLAEKEEESLELELGKSSEVKEEMDTCFNSSEDIPVVDFSGHVKEMHKDDHTGFEREYKSVKDGDHSWEAGQLSENKFKKNRFTNIFPYDCCRVKLASTDEVGSDYINASWINGYKRDKAYIAAQGPMSTTINDFWRMIWENKLPTIVMVTKLVENAREKCSCYWPGAVEEELEAGPDLVILLKEIKVFTDYEIRVMSIKNVSEPDSVPFLVTHFYYLGWPDHGVPEYATSLLGYLRRIRKSHLLKGPPLLVHCSAGVGRTGTFIVLDTMLQRIQSERTINVLQCVQELRERRCQMVQTMSQYVFIHDALNELITCGDTEVAAHNLSIATNQLSRVAPGKSLSGYEEQFQLLDQVSRVPTQQDKDRMSPELAEKNRYPDKFPYMVQQPKLTGISTQDQYINASFIDGYKRRRCFIATQAPLDNTIVDFWKMATFCKPESRTIVLLCDLIENGKSTCAQYWPEEVGGSATYGKVVVKLVSETTDKDVIVRKLEVSSAMKKTVNDSYMLTMFHYKEWNENGTQPELESVLHLNELVISSQRATGNNSIIVMCNDGCGRSGTFLSVYSSIDRFKVEAVVDVFQCVKAARIHRMGLVANVEQYILVHEVVKNYMNSFDQYANFTAQLL